MTLRNTTGVKRQTSVLYTNVHTYMHTHALISKQFQEAMGSWFNKHPSKNEGLIYRQSGIKAFARKYGTLAIIHRLVTGLENSILLYHCNQ